MENKRMSELPVATVVNDEDYTVIVQGGVNKRASKGIFKQKDYNNLNNRPYINSTYSSSLNPTNELMQGTLQFHKISKTGKYGDLLDLPFIATKLSELTNDGYFVQDQYYVHTDNNLTNGLLGKIDSAIQSIKVNETLLTPNENQEINIVIPINLTDLTNDGYFVQDPNYVHTDNNFTTILKNNYDNLVSNVNQPVSSTNKLTTMNDLLAIDTGYWVVIDLYKNIMFDGVINAGEAIPTIGIYAVIEGTENLTISKYTNGVSDDLNLPIKEGYFVFVSGTDTEVIYYIKGNVWKKLSTDLSNYYKKQESDNRYVLQETGKGLMTNAEKTKLSGISTNANKVESSTTNGNIKIDGTETNVYSLTSAEIISALGYTPISDLSNYYNKQQCDNRYIQQEEGKGLITDEERTKLTGISTGANKVQSSNTNGNIRIDGVETVVFSLTKGQVIEALGYTPIEATADLSDYYDKQQSDNRFVQKENDKELILSTDITKLNGISNGANKVEESNTNGNIKIDGVEKTVYSLTSAEIISVLGYTPISDLSNYYNKTQSDNRYVQKETGKELITTAEKTKLSGISTGANKAESSSTNGNIKIDGVEKTVYSLTSAEIISVLGYTPVHDLSDYYNKTQSDNRYVQKEDGKELITSEEKTKLSGISTGANKVENSATNGNIKIDGTEVNVYSLTKAAVITALGYTPPTTNTTYSVVTTSQNGLMSSDMLTKLNGITESADSVSFSQSLTSGTKVGTITINGVNTDIYAPTDTNTHYSTHLYVGTSSGNANAATSNGNTYLMVLDNSTVRDRRLIKGTGGTTVSSNSSGDITIYSKTGPEEVDATFITYWWWYDDGDDLTSAEGLTPEIYSKLVPGTVVDYQNTNSSTSSYSSVILYHNSYYSYKSAGGRYYIKEFTIMSYPGSYSTYTLSGDWLSGGEIVYKGGNLAEGSDSSGGLACFTGDTLVYTENGLIPIEELKVNDKVYSKNKYGEIQLKEITKLFSHITENIYKITVGNTIIKCSWSHPFFIKYKGRIKAKDLKIGDELDDIADNKLVIKNIEIISEPTNVFEISVKDNKNYFVENEKIWSACENIKNL